MNFNCCTILFKEFVVPGIRMLHERDLCVKVMLLSNKQLNHERGYLHYITFGDSKVELQVREKFSRIGGIIAVWDQH